ncbi:hypothetical protein AB8B12_00620, partial [Streptomyces sp. PGLac3x]
MSDPVVRWVYRGDRLRSCVMTFNRGSETYRACGKAGQDWYVVRGGQIPKTCARVGRALPHAMEGGTPAGVP